MRIETALGPKLHHFTYIHSIRKHCFINSLSFLWRYLCFWNPHAKYGVSRNVKYRSNSIVASQITKTVQKVCDPNAVVQRKLSLGLAVLHTPRSACNVNTLAYSRQTVHTTCQFVRLRTDWTGRPRRRIHQSAVIISVILRVGKA